MINPKMIVLAFLLISTLEAAAEGTPIREAYCGKHRCTRADSCSEGFSHNTESAWKEEIEDCPEGWVHDGWCDVDRFFFKEYIRICKEQPPLRYGGSGDFESSETTRMCGSGNIVEALSVEHCHDLHRVSIKCTNEDWQQWAGGHGPGSDGQPFWTSTYYSNTNGFCGMKVKSGSTITALEVDTGDATKRWHSPYGYELEGYWHTDRTCEESPFNGRARLIGFTFFRDASEPQMDGLTPIWSTDYPDQYPEFNKLTYPAHLLQIANAPSGLSGFYEFSRWANGHPVFKQMHTDNCLFFFERLWRFAYCSAIDAKQVGVYMYLSGSFYSGDVSQLNGQAGWKYYDGSWKNVYSTTTYNRFSIIPIDEVPLMWGNTIGYWQHVQEGQGFGAEWKMTVKFTEQSSTQSSSTSEIENTFVNTIGSSLTVGNEVGVSATFRGIGVENKWNIATGLTTSAEEGIRRKIVSSAQEAYSTSRTTSQKCSVTAPNQAYNAYRWIVYRATNRKNVGSELPTCNMRFQLNACKAVPPNCPVGTCLDENCIYCTQGVDPLSPIWHLRANFPACFAEIEGEMRCHPERNDWQCCSASNQCKAGEGDCDGDSDCEGNLVCVHNPYPNHAAIHFEMDICMNPTRRTNRRLLQASMTADPSEDLEFDASQPAPQRISPPAKGCRQFDDEDHCVFGPLYQYCQWDEAKHQCNLKPDVDPQDVPTTDFQWIYALD